MELAGNYLVWAEEWGEQGLVMHVKLARWGAGIYAIAKRALFYTISQDEFEFVVLGPGYLVYNSQWLRVKSPYGYLVV